MEVTRTNFETLFPDIKKDIDNATFICIDGEFTGLSSHAEVTPFDTLSEYYSKTRTGSKDFLLIQLGLCIYRYESETDSYKYTCYNFYAFPKPHNSHAVDFRFLCQSSSIDFLASLGFDFNKLFRDGIPYMTKDEETYLYEKMKEKNKLREASSKAEQNRMTVPDNDKEFVDQIIKKVDFFLKSDEEELVLDRCNSFMRRLLYQELEVLFNNQIFMETKTQENRNIVLVVHKALSPEELALKESQRKEREEKEFKESVGLSRLLQYLSTSGKLIIGHNMLLDVVHIIKQFFGPLPEDYPDFKELVHEVFPKLLDTKVLSSIELFKDKINSSVLGHLLAGLSEDPFNIPKIEQAKEGFGYKDDEMREHEAAYDAFITGKCFLSMAGYLQSPETKSWSGSFDTLSPYLNRIFVMRLQDIPFMNLTGKDVIPSRDHVFYVTFPKEWKNSDIIQLFSAYGTIQIFWISDKSAFVALYRKENSGAVLKGISTSMKTECKVLSYNQYRENRQELNTIYSIQVSKSESALKTFSPSQDAFNKIAKKRRFPSEFSKSKEEGSKVVVIDKHGPTTKVSRKNSEPKLTSTSEVFSVNEDWN